MRARPKTAAPRRPRRFGWWAVASLAVAGAGWGLRWMARSEVEQPGPPDKTQLTGPVKMGQHNDGSVHPVDPPGLPADHTPPSVRFLLPGDGERVSADVALVVVMVEEEHSVSVEAWDENDEPVALQQEPGKEGQWAGDVPISGEGERVLTVRARDEAGNKGEAQIRVHRDTLEPGNDASEKVAHRVKLRDHTDTEPVAVFKMREPEEDRHTRGKEIRVRGRVTRGALPAVWIALGREGLKEVQTKSGVVDVILPLPDHDGPLDLRVLDEPDGSVLAERRITVDRTLPMVEILRPEGGKRISADEVPVIVEVEEDAVRVDAGEGGGKAVALRRRADGEGRWEGAVRLSGEGERTVTVRARDKAGNEGKARVRIDRDTQGPRLVGCLPGNGAEYLTGGIVRVRLEFDEEIREGAITEEIRGRTAPRMTKLVIDPGGRRGKATLHAPRDPGPWILRWKVADRLGNVSSKDVTYEVRQPLPDGFRRRFDIVDDARAYVEGKLFEGGEWFRTDLPLEVRHKKSKIVMRLIPAGRFRMGASPHDPDVLEDEKPAHEVVISKPFYLGKCEVTWEEWENAKAVKKKKPGWLHWLSHEVFPWNPPRPHGFTEDHLPVVNVSWTDAKAFCDALQLRLPTEAEWEYAARAGNATPYPWGTDASKGSRLANTSLSGQGHGSMKKVEESLGPNGLGLRGIIGNAWEWCADWYGPLYYHSHESKDPQGPSQGEKRVVRGGSYLPVHGRLRVSTREARLPSDTSLDTGLRVAADP